MISESLFGEKIPAVINGEKTNGNSTIHVFYLYQLDYKKTCRVIGYLYEYYIVYYQRIFMQTHPLLKSLTIGTMFLMYHEVC